MIYLEPDSRNDKIMMKRNIRGIVDQNLFEFWWFVWMIFLLPQLQSNQEVFSLVLLPPLLSNSNKWTLLAMNLDHYMYPLCKF